MEQTIPYYGEILALLTAVAWATAVILFKRAGEVVHPIGLNLFKGALASVLLFPTILLIGENPFRPASASDYILMFVSGTIGIGIADTLFFICLNRLGAGLTAIVDCLYSPSIITLSLLFLGESLATIQIIGAVLIISAVLTATRAKGVEARSRKEVITGVLIGALSQIANGAGVVMVKPLLDRSPLLWVVQWRLVAGSVSLALLLLFFRNRKAIVKSVFTRSRLGYTLIGSFIGAYVAMMLWLAGMKFTQASVAAALNQTSNVFIFILAALVLKESITSTKVLAIGLAIVGAFLVTFG